MNIDNWFHPSYLIDFTNAEKPLVREATIGERFVSLFFDIKDKYFLSSNDAERLAGRVSAADQTLIDKISKIQKDLIHIISLGDKSSTQQKQAVHQINASFTKNNTNVPLPSLIEAAEASIKKYTSLHPDHKNTHLQQSLEIAKALKEIAPNEARELVNEILHNFANPEKIEELSSPKEQDDRRHLLNKLLNFPENIEGFITLYNFLQNSLPDDKKFLPTEFAETRIKYYCEKLKKLLAEPINEESLRITYRELPLTKAMQSFPQFAELATLKDQCREKLFSFDLTFFKEQRVVPSVSPGTNTLYAPLSPLLQTRMKDLIFNIDVAKPEDFEILQNEQYQLWWTTLAEKIAIDFLKNPRKHCEFNQAAWANIKTICRQAYEAAIAEVKKRIDAEIFQLDEEVNFSVQLQSLSQLSKLGEPFPDMPADVNESVTGKLKGIIDERFSSQEDLTSSELQQLQQLFPSMYTYAIGKVKEKILGLGNELNQGFSQSWITWREYTKPFLTPPSYPEIKEPEFLQKLKTICLNNFKNFIQNQAEIETLRFEDLNFLSLLFSPEAPLDNENLKTFFINLRKTELLKNATDAFAPVTQPPKKTSSFTRFLSKRPSPFSIVEGILKQHKPYRKQFVLVFGADGQSIFSEKDLPEEFLAIVQKHKETFKQKEFLTDADIAALETPT